MKSTSRNLPLRIGLGLSLLLLALAVFGPSLAAHDPLQIYKNLRINDRTYGGPPLRAVPPFETAQFPLGVDYISRDVLSRLLWAVRPTLILCGVVVAARLAVGLLIGMLAGWFGRRVGWLIDVLSVLSGAVPLLLVSIGILIALDSRNSLPIFTLALALTGWLNVATIVQSRIQTVLHAPYIESAQAIGQRPHGIFWRHVMPQVWPALPMVIAAELSATTLLIAELGYLGFYIGGGYTYTDSTRDGPTPDIVKEAAGQPELGQMLSDFFGQYNRTPWV
ncbi:MAG: ABC transporter permease subunit, partial [Herpetosiphonaceae bacterium]|nr:ABC transporter permease subunit [Herpetosiphonaceae bacterium]